MSEVDIELENAKEATLDPKKASSRKGTMSRYYLMPRPIKVLFLISCSSCILLFFLYMKGLPLKLPWSDGPGIVLSGAYYFYLLYCLLVGNIYLGLGATRKQRGKAPPWYDYVLSAILLSAFIWLFINVEAIAAGMFELEPTTGSIVVAIIVGILAIEGGRRIGGFGYTTLLVVSIVYPLFAESVPGIFQGFQLSFTELIIDFAYGANGLRGLPGLMLGSTILGFWLFAGVMMGMGGGEFFLKLATSLLGQVRGGPAKVAVLASGFFGSLSGSIVANIAGTGAFTIPAMKRMGYPPHYAGAIEGCASTGGDTMPPIMGGMVFMCAVIAGVEYVEIMIAATLPTILYYYGLIVQVDSYAAKVGLRGLPKNEIPKVLPTLGSGWPYMVCLIFLIFGLLYFRWGYVTPIYAAGLMAVLALIDGGARAWVRRTRGQSLPTDTPRHMWRAVTKRGEEALVHTAGLINFGAAVFVSMGFILVGLFKTGVAASLTNFIVSLGGDMIFLILFVAMLFNMVMGMVGLQRASYLFLAVTMVPAIASLDPNIPVILLHLFVIFYAGYGGLTPPVALHAFIAASIAGAEPMKTALTSMRLGIVLLFIPFFFVMQPALALQGAWNDILLRLVIAVIGIWVLTSGLEGYMLKIGLLNWVERILFIVGGFMVVFPDTRPIILGSFQADGVWYTIIGAVLFAIGVVLNLLRKRSVAQQKSSLETYVEYPETVSYS